MIAAVTADRRPEARRALEEGAEAERHEQQLQPPVVVMPVMLFCSTSKSPTELVSWYMKITLSTIQPIGKQAEERAVQRGLRGHPGRHAEREDRHCEGDDAGPRESRPSAP
jgi:hypothetical protein